MSKENEEILHPMTIESIVKYKNEDELFCKTCDAITVGFCICEKDEK